MRNNNIINEVFYGSATSDIHNAIRQTDTQDQYEIYKFFDEIIDRYNDYIPNGIYGDAYGKKYRYWVYATFTFASPLPCYYHNNLAITIPIYCTFHRRSAHNMASFLPQCNKYFASNPQVYVYISNMFIKHAKTAKNIKIESLNHKGWPDRKGREVLTLTPQSWQLGGKTPQKKLY